MIRHLIFYTAVLLIFGSLIWVILEEGEKQNPALQNAQHSTKTTVALDATPNNSSQQNEEYGAFFHEYMRMFKNQISSPLSILLVQILIIIAFSRVLGLTISKIGQPIVIGEIIAGIVLGPSLLGSLYPETFNFIFPAHSLNNLQLFSQFGLLLFMFIIGMEIDTKVIQKKINSAVIISFTGIMFPYFLGILLAFFIYSSFAMPGVSFTTFALFIGIAMSITAFPVLARIIHEKGLTKTPLGIMAIACAATDDITAWLIFAAIIAIAQAGSAISALVNIIIVLIFVISMLFFAQPILKRIGRVYISSENLSKTVIAFIFLILFSSAFFTEGIGIHALFGAFIAGVIIPKSHVFKKLMTNKIEDISTVVLLPLFFAFSGLRTQIGLLNTPHLWFICFFVIIIAIIGKLGGVALAARFVGNTWKDSISMGVLMNTRGLMELIVLNIGYDLGILSPEIFSIMVIMALTTTFMTGPVLAFIEYIYRKYYKTNHNALPFAFNILVSFGIPKMGASLLKLISNFTNSDISKQRITAMHLTPHTEITHADALKYEAGSFAPVRSVAKQLQIHLNTIYKTTDDVTKEVLKTVKREKCNFLAIGAAKSIFTNNMLGGKVRTFIKRSNCNVGVFIDKDFKDLARTLFITDDASMLNMLGMIRLLEENSKTAISLADTIEINTEYPYISSYIEKHKGNLEIISSEFENPDFFNQFDLVVISFRFFEKNFKNNPILVESNASLLIVNFHDDRFQEFLCLN